MKRRYPALLCALALCLSLLPAASASGQAAPKTYEEAVAELQSDSHYETEQSFDSEYGTIFCYDLGAVPHANHGFMVLICKAPCAKGDGAVVDLPHPRHDIWTFTQPPQTMELSEDGESFTYSYHYDESLTAMYTGETLRPAGDFIYTVDLTTGEVTAQEPETPDTRYTYASAMEKVKNTPGQTVEQVLESPICTVLLTYFSSDDGRRSYSIYLVYKSGNEKRPEGYLDPLTLPVTRNDGSGKDNFPVYYTDRAPDSLELSGDGKYLTYRYDDTYFGEPSVCTLELATGLSSSAVEQAFSDVPAGSWFEQGVRSCAEKGVMEGTGEGLFSPDTNLTDAECLALALRLYDLRRGGDGTLEKAPEDAGYMTFTLSDGKTFYHYGDIDPFFGYNSFNNAAPGGNSFYAVYVLAPGETTGEREAYAKAHEGTATFMAEGKTYTGTVVADNSSYDGPCLRFTFDCPKEEQPDLDVLFGSPLPAPDKWYRDAVYTARQWGLDNADGISILVDRTVSLSGPYTTNRGIFARSLATAAGELEKKYTVERIPDLERSEYTEAIYGLYEVGILGGMDDIGTFHTGKSLTRAEAAVMVARVLDESQRLDTPPAAPSAYDLAVAELRGGTGHHNERTFETDDCTVFVYDRDGFMNAPSGRITIIYKASSPLGEGTVIDPPHVRAGMQLTPADTMVFDPEKETFTYSYFFDTTVYDSSIKSHDTHSGPGTYTFTVDLPTGEIHREYRGVDYAGAMTHVTRESQEVVQTLDSGQCTAVLTKGQFVDKYDDYFLSLVYKPGSALGDGTIKQLILPSTVSIRGYSYHFPTDRAPDSLKLSEDGSKLVYTYRFDDRLAITYFGQEDETVLHETGTYTYTVDLATGELSVSHEAAQ